MVQESGGDFTDGNASGGGILFGGGEWGGIDGGARRLGRRAICECAIGGGGGGDSILCGRVVSGAEWGGGGDDLRDGSESAEVDGKPEGIFGGVGASGVGAVGVAEEDSPIEGGVSGAEWHFG